MKKHCSATIAFLLCNCLLYLTHFNGYTQITPAFPYKDPSLPVDARVTDLVSRMTIDEKVTQLFNESPAIERLGIPGYNWWNECLHGVARAGKATVFPQAIGMAATFDENLLFRIGEAIAVEARAKHNFFVANNVRSIYTGLTFWSPNINIFRDPRWGRGQETYGEDPYLTGRMGVNFIKGLQGDDPKYFKTIATAKHYAVHSGPEFTRHTDNIFVNDNDLYNTYLPAFKAVVQEANVQSVMCAYNRFRDKPCCGSDLLLSNILRNEFGFKGYVVSDCGAITDFYKPENHDMVKTPARAWGWSIAAGTDINCEESKAFLQDSLQYALKTGIISEKDINVSLSRLLKARFQLGMFDPKEMVPFSNIPIIAVGSAENLALTLEAAEKSLVLLKNNGILPLRAGQKIALIGPNADNFSTLIGNYNGDPINPVTPLQALRGKAGKKLFYSAGGALIPGVYTNHAIVEARHLFHLENGKLKKGLTAKYYANPASMTTPQMQRIDETINFTWHVSPLSGKVDDEFGVRWSGIIIPTATGTYQFEGTVKPSIDGKLVTAAGITMEKGKQYQLEAGLEVKSFWWGNNIDPKAVLSWVDMSFNYQQEALKAAGASDVVIFCGGISPNLEGEEMPLTTAGFSHGDRTSIDLPSVQEDLLKEIYKTGKPVVYINFSGSAIALNWQNANAAAIVQAFYPGEASGTAIARLLFGEMNPSGRLPVTFYKSVDDLPAFENYDMQGRTYRYFKGDALYKFGFGLSYTSYAYSNLKLPATITAGKVITITADITNTGKMGGEEVAQLYLKNINQPYGAPSISLGGVKRVYLQPGEKKQVVFTLDPYQVSELNAMMDRTLVAGDWEISLGGRQPDSISLAAGNAVKGIVTISVANSSVIK
ncbi:MAG: glycoside hydrolase family 3 C-terminal domain-containing protein [Ferruginibacter sp.]|nr:glycoside hydrolase family 3 C-terminal domain-containing protein [Ferruginibacter sp.]